MSPVDLTMTAFYRPEEVPLPLDQKLAIPSTLSKSQDPHSIVAHEALDTP